MRDEGVDGLEPSGGYCGGHCGAGWGWSTNCEATTLTLAIPAQSCGSWLGFRQPINKPFIFTLRYIPDVKHCIYMYTIQLPH